MKKVKKNIVFLVVTILAIIAVPFSVSASADNMKVVYVTAPADWENPCLWAWSDDGTNAFAAWPGGKLEKDEGNDNWYYTHIPSSCTNVIVNANDGAIQTSDYKTEGKDVWITVTDKDTVDISFDKKTTGDIPAYIPKFSIHVTVPENWTNVNAWAWNDEGVNAFEAWPGCPMDKNEETGTYNMELPEWVENIIINNGEVQTSDIKIDAAELWLTIADDTTYTLSYDDPSKAGLADINVYTKVPQDWSAPCLWAWSAPDGTNAFSSWPGEAFAEGDDGWFTKTAPGFINSVIINANEGTVQTTDISVETGKDIWIVVNGPEDFTVTYEKPELSEDTTVTEDKGETTAATEDNKAVDVAADKEDSNTTMIVVIIVAAVVVIGAVSIIIVKKRK